MSVYRMASMEPRPFDRGNSRVSNYSVFKDLSSRLRAPIIQSANLEIRASAILGNPFRMTLAGAASASRQNSPAPTLASQLPGVSHTLPLLIELPQAEVASISKAERCGNRFRKLESEAVPRTRWIFLAIPPKLNPLEKSRSF